MLDHYFMQAQVYIVTIAEEGSFSRAARRLRTSQSFLTRKVGELEQSLGVRIFERSTRRLELTTAGKLVVPEIQRALRYSDRAWELARYCGRIAGGPIRIGYSSYVHGALLRMLHQLDLRDLDVRQTGNGDFPGPRVVLESTGTPELVERVLRGKLHAAFGVQPVEERELWMEPVAREPFCLCVPKNHELARRPAIAARDLHGELLFWVPRHIHPAFYDRIITYVGSTGAQPVYHEVRSTTHAIEIVSHGFGLALLPQAAARLSHTGVMFKTVTDRLLRIETVLFAKRELVHGTLQELVSFLVGRLQGPKQAVQ